MEKVIVITGTSTGFGRTPAKARTTRMLGVRRQFTETERLASIRNNLMNSDRRRRYNP
jgi:hypothetical protein